MAIIRQPFRSDPQKVYSPEAADFGIQLAALVNAHINDPAKLEALVTKAGFAQDSCGQWFHEHQQVPTPTALQPTVIAISGRPLL